MIALAARLRRHMMDGAADVIAFTAAAATADATVGATYAAAQGRSRAGIERVCMRLDTLGALRRDLDVSRAVDAAYSVLHHAVWTRLVDECGWSADAAEAWYVDVLSHVLLGRDVSVLR